MSTLNRGNRDCAADSRELPRYDVDLGEFACSTDHARIVFPAMNSLAVSVVDRLRKKLMMTNISFRHGTVQYIFLPTQIIQKQNYHVLSC